LEKRLRGNPLTLPFRIFTIKDRNRILSYTLISRGVFPLLIRVLERTVQDSRSANQQPLSSVSCYSSALEANRDALQIGPLKSRIPSSGTSLHCRLAGEQLPDISIGDRGSPMFVYIYQSCHKVYTGWISVYTARLPVSILQYCVRTCKKPPCISCYRPSSDVSSMYFLTLVFYYNPAWVLASYIISSTVDFSGVGFPNRLSREPETALRLAPIL
jgi:hypothetical protein